MIIHPKPSKGYNQKKGLGYVHVYTGEGKGKTSAALGVLLRASGQGLKVVMIQFLKGQRDAGDFLAAQNLPNVEIIQFGRPDLTSLDQLQAMDNYLAAEGLNYARNTLRSRRPDVLILDEITTAVQRNLIPIQDVIDFIDNRHRNVELILTGREAHPALLNLADLVTVMQSSKDYFGYDTFSPRLGIEH